MKKILSILLVAMMILGIGSAGAILMPTVVGSLAEVYGFTGGVGFLIAIVLFASVRERTRFSEYPKAFEGFPIALITAGLLALCFMGFSGMSIG